MDLKRNTPAALLAALSGASFWPVVLVDLDWPDGRVRAHSGKGELTFGGEIFHGAGKFGSVTLPEEGLDGVPEEFSLSFTCELDELAAYADTVIRGREGVIYLGATTERGGNDLIDAVDLMSGTCDGLVLKSEVADDQGMKVILYTLTVTFSTGPSYRTMAAIAHSNEDQKRHYPADTAGRHLILAQAEAEKTLWPEP